MPTWATAERRQYDPPISSTSAALVIEAVLHLDRDRAAERIESENRVAREHVEPVDRPLRDEVPVHRVAEGLVDAHAVLVDRQALRHADHGRSLKAAVLHVGLERVPRGVIDVDARHPLQQRVREARRFRRVEILGRQGHGIRRHLEAVDQAGIGRDRLGRAQVRARPAGVVVRRGRWLPPPLLLRRGVLTVDSGVVPMTRTSGSVTSVVVCWASAGPGSATAPKASACRIRPAPD